MDTELIQSIIVATSKAINGLGHAYQAAEFSEERLQIHKKVIALTDEMLDLLKLIKETNHIPDTK